ncbi:MAG: helix-turn-helix domain-containing protein [Novipirellula sp. JB048]
MSEVLKAEGRQLFTAEEGADAVAISNEAVAALLQHPWPGNVRELQQLMYAAAVLCENNLVTRTDLGLSREREADHETVFTPYLELPLSEARAQLVEDFERLAIQRALEMESHNVSAAARRLGIHRQSLQQKMKALEIA